MKTVSAAHSSVALAPSARALYAAWSALASGGSAIATIAALAHAPLLDKRVDNALDPAAAARAEALAQQNPLLIGAAIVVAVPCFLAYLFGVTIWLIWLGRRVLASASSQEQGDRQPAHAIAQSSNLPAVE